MRRASILAIVFTALTHSEPLDRIAVSIGTQVVTESAVLLDLRVSALLDRMPVDLSATAKRRSAERLTDQVLILREATESHLALPTNATALMNDLRAQYGSDYTTALKRYGVQESDVAAQVLAGLIGLTFTELRFRPAVQISEEDMRAYFATLPGEGTFESVRDQIEDLLLRRRAIEGLDQWLATARTAAHVQFREAVFR